MTDGEFKVALLIAAKDQGLIDPRVVPLRRKDGSMAFKLYHGLLKDNVPGTREAILLVRGADTSNLRQLSALQNQAVDRGSVPVGPGNDRPDVADAADGGAERSV